MDPRHGRLRGHPARPNRRHSRSSGRCRRSVPGVLPHLVCLELCHVVSRFFSAPACSLWSGAATFGASLRELCLDRVYLKMVMDSSAAGAANNHHRRHHAAIADHDNNDSSSNSSRSSSNDNMLWVAIGLPKPNTGRRYPTTTHCWIARPPGPARLAYRAS